MSQSIQKNGAETHAYVCTQIRRRQIAKAALEIIAEEGPEKFRGRLIAQKIGITDGTVFRHFKDKQAIMDAALDLLEEELQSLAASLQALDPAEALYKFFLHRAKLLAGPRAVGRLVFSDQLAAISGERGAARIRGWQEDAWRFVNEKIERLQDRKLLRQDLNVAVLSQMYFGFLITFSQQPFVAGSASKSELPHTIRTTWQHLCVLLELREKQE